MAVQISDHRRQSLVLDDRVAIQQEHMPPATQAELKADDSLAWNQVVGLLILIISIGLVLAVGTALFSGVLSIHL